MIGFTVDLNNFNFNRGLLVSFHLPDCNFGVVALIVSVQFEMSIDAGITKIIADSEGFMSFIL